MAPFERKRKTKSQTQESTSDKEWWEIKAIVDERTIVDRRTKRKRVEYLIDWEGTDPETGEAWEKSWSRRKHIAELAIEEWKAKRGSASARATKPESRATSTVSASSLGPRATEQKKDTSRRRKTRAHPVRRESVTAQSSELSSPASSQFTRSTRRSRQPSSSGSATRSPVSQPPAQSSSFRSTGVVLESEPEDEEQPSASYVPTTQTTGSGASHLTASQPRISHSSTRETRHTRRTNTFSPANLGSTSQSTVISTSLLDDSPPSSARSIPETEPDVELTPSDKRAVDRHTEKAPVQPQTHSQYEIPGTFETGRTLSSAQEPPVQDNQACTQEPLLGAPQSTAEETPEREIPSTTQKQHESAAHPESSHPNSQQVGAQTEEQGTTLNSVGGSQFGPNSGSHLETLSNEQSETLVGQPKGPRHKVHSQDKSSIAETPSNIRDHQVPSSNRTHVSQAFNTNIDNGVNFSSQDFAHHSNLTRSGIEVQGATPSTAQAPSQEQHAQVVSNSPILSTQHDYSEEVRTTVEHHSATVNRSSRHDSSQSSPKFSDSAGSPSPAARPPKQSLDTLGTLDTNANPPPRPRTPTSSSSSAIMNSNELGKSPAPTSVAEMIAQRRAEAKAKTAATMEARKLEKLERERLWSSPTPRSLSAKPEAAPESGTRSPSTIPDRPLAPQGPTSLRTVATSLQEPTSAPSAAQNEDIGGHAETGADDEAVVEVEATSAAPVDVEMEDVHQSDDDEDMSELNDDLQLQPNEYIVPLPFNYGVQLRQASVYQNFNKKLDKFRDPRSRESESAQQEIEQIFQELRLIETHYDLLVAPDQASQPDEDQSERDKHMVGWSKDVSVKFKFLEALLLKLQLRELHLILLVGDENNTRLFHIIESYLRGADFTFESPITGQMHSSTDETKLLRITILSSTTTRVLREAHLIVCLHGNPDAAEVRKRPWTLKPNRSGVPLLHLVIPRTISHIERYLSTKLSKKTRQHVIIATLSQFAFNETLGQAVGSAVGHASNRQWEIRFVDEIVKFLLPSEEESGLSEWPVPAIGSIKDIIEMQSQQPLEDLNSGSPLPGSNAAGKRPLLYDNDRDDPSKRMRLTPQPQTQADTSHVSDSTPGASLSVEQQRDWWRQEAIRSREENKSFEARQTLYEEMGSKYRNLKKEKENAEKRYADSEAREAKLREQLSSRTADNVELRQRLEEQRGFNALSDDDKIKKIAEMDVEVQGLKEELAKETKAKESAIANKTYADTTREYMEEQCRDARSQATSATEELSQANDKIAKLERAANARPLMQQHHTNQSRLSANRETRLTTENTLLKKQLEVKSQEAEKHRKEMDRMKMTRGVGGGTRAASVGARTPRPGSRATSPLPNGGRDRVANLRNG